MSEKLNPFIDDLAALIGKKIIEKTAEILEEQNRNTKNMDFNRLLDTLIIEAQEASTRVMDKIEELRKDNKLILIEDLVEKEIVVAINNTIGSMFSH